MIRLREDVSTLVGRARDEAAVGYLQNALARLTELSNDFPKEAYIYFQEALLRLKYLGDGRVARDLFRNAYQLGLQSKESHDIAALAAFNATWLASETEECLLWSERSLALPLERKLQSQLKELVGRLKGGINCGDILRRSIEYCDNDHELGKGAALMEILAEIDPGLETFVGYWRERAERLRLVDKIFSESRRLGGMAYPGSERLSLARALCLIEKANSLDPYNAELWNLRSAWSHLLQQDEAAIRYADEAIAHSPASYPKPHINRAIALLALGRLEEAEVSAKVGKETAGENVDDVKLAESLLAQSKGSTQAPELETLVSNVIDGVMFRAKEEINRTGSSLMFYVNGLIGQSIGVAGETALQHTSMFKELLAIFSAESASTIAWEASNIISTIQELSLYAALYLATSTNGEEQRDAIRFVIYFICRLSLTSTDRDVRTIYRETIMPIAAAGGIRYSNIDNRFRDELERMRPSLGDAIVKQDEPNVSEREKGAETIARHGLSEPGESASKPRVRVTERRLRDFVKGRFVQLLKQRFWRRP
jgi:hypothetical protein